MSMETSFLDDLDAFLAMQTGAPAEPSQQLASTKGSAASVLSLSPPEAERPRVAAPKRKAARTSRQPSSTFATRSGEHAAGDNDNDNTHIWKQHSQPSAHGSADDFLDWTRVPSSSRYVHWAQYISSPLATLRTLRGKQTRPVTISSFCSGLCPESKILDLFGFEVNHAWSCDHKASAVRFSEQNETMGKHHYVNLDELLQKGQSMCAKHGFETCSLPESGGKSDQFEYDLMFAGISCKAYSLARSGRALSWLEHRDVYLMNSWIFALLKLRPRAGLLENVAGFCAVDKVSNTAPIQVFLGECQRRGVFEHYKCRIFFKTSPYLVWLRKRVWLLFVKKNADGTCPILDGATSLVQDRFHCARRSAQEYA